MKRPYIPAGVTVEELEIQYDAFRRHHIKLENVCVSASFEDYVKKLKPKKDGAIVYSLTCFSSITELLECYNTLKEKNIELTSLTDKWFSNEDIATADFLREMLLLGAKMHAQTHAKQVLSKIARPKRLPRPASAAALAALAPALIPATSASITSAAPAIATTHELKAEG